MTQPTECTLTELDISNLEREFLTWFVRSGIQAALYFNVIQFTSEKLAEIKAPTMEKALQAGRQLIKDAEEKIRATETSRPFQEGAEELEEQQRVPIDYGDEEHPEFNKNEDVEIVNRPDSPDPDPYNGTKGKIATMKFMRNHWVYAVLPDEEMRLIPRRASNLRKWTKK